MGSKLFSLKFLSDLPHNAKVYIYGAGKFGNEIFSIIRKFRSDIKILGFIDTFRSGKGTILFEDFKENLPECDRVVIASGKYWKEMEQAVKSLGYNAIVPFKYKLELSSEEKEKIEIVKKMIGAGEDTYELVIDSIINRDLNKVYNYHKKKRNRHRQYIDFVSLQPGFKIIEGGVYKGEISKRFFEITDGKCVVFGFEIWGDRFLPNDLKENPQFKLYKKALWSKETTLFFPKDFENFISDGAFVVEEVTEYANQENFEKIEAISIDDFVFKYSHCEKVDFIKLDVEGAELEVVQGAKGVIREFKPQMAIAVYHEFSHFYEIALLVKKINPAYKLCFEHYGKDFSDSIMYFM